MSTISEVLSTLKTAFSTDAAIVTYCQQKYTRNPTVYIFVNPDDPPVEAEYPIIAITSIARSLRSETEKFRTYTLDISVAIRNETRAVETALNGSKLVEFLGGTEVEELREKVEAAVFNAKIALKTSFLGSTITEIEFPCFRCDMTLELAFRESTRSPLK